MVKKLLNNDLYNSICYVLKWGVIILTTLLVLSLLSYIPFYHDFLYHFWMFCFFSYMTMLVLDYCLLHSSKKLSLNTRMLIILLAGFLSTLSVYLAIILVILISAKALYVYFKKTNKKKIHKTK